ncbi:MAG: alpha-1,2-fucosyltransferase, partial [Lachnospiraceae bacterium]
RRGDYEDKWLLPITYYHDAISYIKSNYDDAHFYIFCEDLDYSIKHFGTKEDCTIIANSFSFSDLEEFHLISKCKHQIIANSSFSWWAAYLNTNTDSTIIAPIFLQWTKEYYPPEWITLS